jgi:hypothetical protein
MEDKYNNISESTIQDKVLSQHPKVEMPSTNSRGDMKSSISTIKEENSMVSDASLMMGHKIPSIGGTDGGHSNLKANNRGSFPISNKRMGYAKSSISSKVMQNKISNPLNYPNIIVEESVMNDNLSANRSRRADFGK